MWVGAWRKAGKICQIKNIPERFLINLLFRILVVLFLFLLDVGLSWENKAQDLEIPVPPGVVVRTDHGLIIGK